jgi:DNA-binding NarL/FixJ family response regulator
MASKSADRKIRVVLVDDHVLMRIGLTFALNNQPDIQVVGEAGDGSEAVAVCRDCSPDVVVLDLRMPGQNGIETIGQLCRESTGPRVLVLSNYGSGDEIESALQAGALGFVRKDTPLAGVVEAIRNVHQGIQHLPREASGTLARWISSQLSQREIEVLKLIGKGLTNKEIADALHVTESTIKGHVTGLLTKLGVSDRTQAVLSGFKKGLIHLE